MARINLLPWRQEERLRKNQEFNVMAAAAAVLAALVALLALTYLNNQLSDQQSANEMISNENKRIEGVLEDIKALEAQRDEMVSRMKIVQDLQGRRSVPVRIWDDIARAVPNNMYLVGIKREGDTITLSGFAANNSVVSQLVRNLDASPWLGSSLIPQIKTNVQAYSVGGDGQRTGGESTRGILPEDDYVEFTVTTQVKADADTKPEEETTDTQGVPVVSDVPVAASTEAVLPANANSSEPQANSVQQSDQDTATTANPQDIKPAIADNTLATQNPTTPADNAMPAADNSKNAPATPSVQSQAQTDPKTGAEQNNGNAPATSQIHQTNTGGQS